jgi:rhodanese-related sulfurtransferase
MRISPLVPRLLLRAVALLPRLFGRVRGETAPAWIEADELAARLGGGGGFAVIDVRGPDEFTGPLGHVGDALNVPLGDLDRRLTDLAPLAEGRVVLVCHTDRRSAQAAGMLREAGFRDVRVLRGGMVRWTEAGLPVAGR